MIALKTKTIPELRLIAKNKGYTGYTRLAKDDLIKFIMGGGSFNSTNKKASVIKVEVERPCRRSSQREAEVGAGKISENYTDDFLRLKKTTPSDFVKVRQLGKPGKEGVVYLVTNGYDKYAMKTFRKTKSGATLEKEAFYQHVASKKGISPRIIEYNPDDKYIIMELLDKTLMEIIEAQKGLSKSQQEQILQLYKKLDEVGVMLNDANPLNIMEKNGRLYAIDYGFAKFTSHKDFKDYEYPNEQLMPLGLMLWLKDCCKSTDVLRSLTVIKNAIPPDIQTKFKLH